MHLADGIVNAPVLVGSTVLAVGGVAIGLKKTDYDQIPQVAMMSAAFFVASLIHVPIGPAQVHLILNGLTGIILGWAAFPAILIALLLQSILFGYGGITVIGANTLNMALPAVCCYYLFSAILRKANSRGAVFITGFSLGSFAIALSGVMIALTLYLSSKDFLGVISAILIAHIPIMIIEGVLTGAVLVFILKVCPHILTTRK